MSIDLMKIIKDNPRHNKKTKKEKMRELVFKIEYDKTLEKWVIFQKESKNFYRQVCCIKEKQIGSWLKKNI